MKAQSALMAAAIMVIAPAIAAAQPAQTPPDQGSAQAKDAPKADNASSDAKAAAKSDPKCDTGKSADAGAKASTSAKVGKDTGVLPPPRKKAADTACAAQPQ